MAPERCQPFDLNRQGLILGEGAGMVVLESEAHAVRRNAFLHAEVGGYGLSCDGYHITRPHPDAMGSIAAMRAAIERREEPMLLYNLACYESLAGRADDAVAHLRRAIELDASYRELAHDDADFAPVRDAVSQL
jgi:3-oxoacyl-[acyl-carrier-protein] synthase II